MLAIRPQPKFDGVFEKPRWSELGFVAAVAWLAYQAGKSSATSKKSPLPTIGAVVGSYIGLRAMDTLFNGVVK